LAKVLLSWAGGVYMPATATDDGFPGKVERLHFYELLGGLAALGTALMTYWFIFD
jgi:hypothetical protein